MLNWISWMWKHPTRLDEYCDQAMSHFLAKHDFRKRHFVSENPIEQVSYSNEFVLMTIEYCNRQLVIEFYEFPNGMPESYANSAHRDSDQSGAIWVQGILKLVAGIEPKKEDLEVLKRRDIPLRLTAWAELLDKHCADVLRGDYALAKMSRELADRYNRAWYPEIYR